MNSDCSFSEENRKVPKREDDRWNARNVSRLASKWKAFGRSDTKIHTQLRNCSTRGDTSKTSGEFGITFGNARNLCPKQQNSRRTSEQNPSSVRSFGSSTTCTSADTSAHVLPPLSDSRCTEEGCGADSWETA